MNLEHDNITQTEYRVMRETLGVPVEWVADKIGVQTRSAQRWESNPNTPPIQPAIALIVTTYEMVLRKASDIVDPPNQYPQYVKVPVKLWRYYNQSHIDEVKGEDSLDVEVHNATVRFAYLLLTMRGIAVEVHFAPWGDNE